MILLVMHFNDRVYKGASYSYILCNTIFILIPLFIWSFAKVVDKFTGLPAYLPDVDKAQNTNNQFVSRFRKLFVPIMLVLSCFWLLSFVIVYVEIYGTGITLLAISSFKIAVLSVAILNLVKILLSSNDQKPTLNNLINIRRGLMFNNINLDLARNLTEVALNGLDKSSIIQAEVSNCISTLQKIDVELNNAIKKNEAAVKLVSERNDKPEDDVKILWESLRDVTFSYFERAREIYLSDKTLQYGLERHVRMYRFVEQGNTNYIQYLEKLYDLYDQVRKKYNSTICTWLNCVREFEGEDSALSWTKISIKQLEYDPRK